MCREVGKQVFLVTLSFPSLRTVAPPPCLLLDIKDSLKEDVSFFDGGCIEGVLMGISDWLLLLLAVCLHQSSFLHQELYT
jgi:hypothetical protein